MTKEERLLFAMSEIDDELIEEAAAPYKQKRSFTNRLIGLAATVAIVVMCSIGLNAYLSALIEGDGSNMNGSDHGSGGSGSTGNSGSDGGTAPDDGYEPDDGEGQPDEGGSQNEPDKDEENKDDNKDNAEES